MGFKRFTFIFVALLFLIPYFSYATVPVNNNVANIPATACTPSDFGGTCAGGSGGTGNVGIGTIGQEAVYIGTTSVGSGIITDNGTNIGIAKSSPGAALDVNGTIRTVGFTMSGQTPVAGYVLTSTDNSGDAGWRSAAGTGTVTSVGLSTPNSTLTLGGTNPITGSGTISADINLTNANTWTGQQIFNTANVGIGSSYPGAQLDIQGTLRVFGNVGIGTSAGSGNTYQILAANGGSSFPSYSFQNSTNSGLFAPPGQPVGSIAFATAGSTNFTIRTGETSIWNETFGPGVTGVDLGTSTNPFQNGWFYGNIGIGTQSTGVYPLVWNNKLAVQGGVSIGTSYAQQTAPSSGLLIQGNVGIGTWAPKAPLQIIGAVGQNQAIIGDGTENFTFYTSGGTTQMGSFNNTPLDLFTNNGAVQERLSTNGGVAIGSAFVSTTIPTSGLIVQGNIGLGTWLSANRLDVQGGVGIGTAYAGYYAAPANGLAVQGNVGIGSTAPGQNLDVQGTVRAIGFTMTGQTPTAGYVLTSQDNKGDATWSPAGSGSGTVTSIVVQSPLSGGTITTTGNVGIGTALGNISTFGASGNVGIGTASANQLLFVQGNAFFLNSLYGTETFATGSSITPSGNYKYSYMANTQGAATFTVNNPTNVPTVNGATWVLKMSSTAVQTFSWAGDYTGGNIGLPTATDATGNIQYFVFTWDAIHSHYDYMGNGGGFS